MEEAKQKALDKLQLEKDMHDELEKQRLEKLQTIEDEIEGDVDGFHLFNEHLGFSDEDLEDIPEALKKVEIIEDKIPEDDIPKEQEVETEITPEQSEEEDDEEDDDEDLPADDESEGDHDAEWEKAQLKKQWSIVYSKKPELIIEKEEYDKILIDMMQSYAEYKQSTMDREKLKEIEEVMIANNQENRRSTRRNSKSIRKFFRNIFENYIDGSIKIDDVKLKFRSFRKYVRVVSNYEIELIDDGDASELKKYCKNLWKRLADEHTLVKLEVAKKKSQDEEEEFIEEKIIN